MAVEGRASPHTLECLIGRRHRPLRPRPARSAAKAPGDGRRRGRARRHSVRAMEASGGSALHPEPPPSRTVRPLQVAFLLRDGMPPGQILAARCRDEGAPARCRRCCRRRRWSASLAVAEGGPPRQGLPGAARRSDPRRAPLWAAGLRVVGARALSRSRPSRSGKSMNRARLRAGGEGVSSRMNRAARAAVAPPGGRRERGSRPTSPTSFPAEAREGHPHSARAFARELKTLAVRRRHPAGEGLAQTWLRRAFANGDHLLVGGGGPSRRPGAPRPQGHCHHGDLHPREDGASRGRPRRLPPPRRARGSGDLIRARRPGTGPAA